MKSCSFPFAMPFSYRTFVLLILSAFLLCRLIVPLLASSSASLFFISQKAIKRLQKAVWEGRVNSGRGKILESKH